MLGSYYRNKSCFSYCVKQKLGETTFLPILDNGDVCKRFHCPHMLDNGVLRFVINCGRLTQHSVLYYKINWTSLCIQQLSHWCVVI